MTARFLIGDVRDALATLPDQSIDLVVTSPPYLSLRSYLPADHPDKRREIGAEPNPAAFIDTLLDVTELLGRVLAPHGSICIELGDTYSGSGGAGGDYNEGGWREGQNKFRQARPEFRPGWPLDRSLTLVPESYRWALVYGRNPFNGRETPQWIVRNVVRHFRPNPAIGRLGGKFRPATSEWAVATRASLRVTGANRYFDLDAVRTHDGPGGNPTRRATLNKGFPRYDGDYPRNTGHHLEVVDHPGGAPPRDWWDDDDLEWADGVGLIEPTSSYPGAHYATFSPSVIRRLIEPMCPHRVCIRCGKPSERITQKTVEYAAYRATRSRPSKSDAQLARHLPDKGGVSGFDNSDDDIARGRLYETLGWSCCGCCTDGTPGIIGETCRDDHWRRGIVLDPFGGSGTSASVAEGLGRDSILIDLDSRNYDLAQERCGMFLEPPQTIPTPNV